MGEDLVAHKKYKVRQGDCISSIAFRYGFFPDTIWNDSKNSKLKQERKDPNVLKLGDEVYIRDKEEKEESCASEQRHRFRRKGVPEKLIIHFKCDGELRANEAYVLNIDGDLSEGKTDKKGKVEIPIPPDAKKGNITFRGSDDKYNLNLGHLDPITETSGVKKRLRNMGFYDGPVDGKMSPEFENALRLFQEDHDLKSTGKLDDTTRKKIEEAYSG
ncbi:MAG: peptidoglycan-binding protein [Nitrospinales bacterium]